MLFVAASAALAAFTTYWVIWYPPPLGSRESVGAVTTYESNSSGVREVLSVTVTPLNQRRAYPTSTDTRGMTSCCTVRPHCQSFSRTPQPFSVAGLTCVTMPDAPPKFRLLPVSAAQVSTDPLAGFCRPRFSRLQSTTLSLSLSVQARS